jgi:hypothetical protein
VAPATDLPTITISPDILRLLPRDSELANLIVNEILARMLKDESMGDDDCLANRPDWQTAVELGRRARREGKVISHDDVLAWHNQHR